MLTTRCSNCGNRKETDEYAEPQCKTCNQALADAEAYATKNNVTNFFELDQLKQNALLLRRKELGIGSRPDPRQLYNPVDVSDLAARLGVVPGSIDDPRRSGGR